MSKKIARNSSYDSGIASEFLVFSNLIRLGVNAFISFGNKKSIDIVIKSKTSSAISVDVKSVRGYSSIVVNNVISQPNHFIVVVVYKGKFTDPTFTPDYFIIPSKQIAKLQSTFGKEKRLMVGALSAFKDMWAPLLV